MTKSVSKISLETVNVISDAEEENAIPQDLGTTDQGNVSRKLKASKDDLDLRTKLQEFIRKSALMAMGQDYAYNSIEGIFCNH